MYLLLHFASLVAFLSISGYAASVTVDQDQPGIQSNSVINGVHVHIGEGTEDEIYGRTTAQHSLSSEQWSHLQRVTSTFYETEFEYTSTKNGFDDHYSVQPGDDDECLVLIAATQTASQWITNLIIPLSTLKDDGTEVLRAHYGFVIAAEGIEKKLMSRINSNCGSRSVVTFAGHSRGAGIAPILASMYYKRNVFETIKLVTWGAPRTLSDTSADEFHKKYYQIRVVNKDDVVTTVPSKGIGFKHFGVVVCLDCTKTGQDSEADFSLDISIHLMKNYNKKIQAITV
eukprot:CFRG5996T1